MYKSILLLLLLSPPCHAGTFTVTRGDPELICESTGFKVVFYSTVTFDEDTLQIVSADYDTAACGERTFTHTRIVEVVPAIFPNPPVFEERTVTDTIRLLDWGRWQNNNPVLRYDEPRFSNGEWKRTIAVDGRTTGVTIERTLIGPLTTKTIIQNVDNSIRGGLLTFTLNENGKWRTDSAGVGPRREIDRIVHLPIVVHDGVTWDYGTSPLPGPGMPVVPEPSSLNLVWIFLLRYLVRSKSSRPPTNPPVE